MVLYDNAFKVVQSFMQARNVQLPGICLPLVYVNRLQTISFLISLTTGWNFKMFYGSIYLKFGNKWLNSEGLATVAIKS